MAAARKKMMMDKRASMGLSGITSQIYRKVNKKGFEFCLMVAGETGLGKSTLINTLFLQEENLSEESARTTAEERIPQTVDVTPRQYQITESGVQLKLTVVDTPGFSDAVNNENCWEPIVDYIDQTFENYLRDENKVDRKRIRDDRVHCLLYFINPTGRGLKPLDIAALKALQSKVNIVPVIAKADTLTRSEVKQFKEQVMAQVQEHDIQLFVPSVEEEEGEEEYLENVDLVSRMPFAVVGCNKIVQVGGRSVRGRVYPWGTVEVDNEEHCDFQRLRKMLVRSHLQDLKDVTGEILYENWRKEALVRDPGLGHHSAFNSDNNLSMEQRDQNNVSGTEAELIRRHEQMKRDLEEQQRLLEEKKRQFEEERLRYEKAKMEMEQ
eukprot:m.143355 g.143355  ORF g.143355 m.143355 type:complete len:381 (-) comp20431_c3_seq1:259-1401(-)